MRAALNTVRSEIEKKGKSQLKFNVTLQSIFTNGFSGVARHHTKRYTLFGVFALGHGLRFSMTATLFSIFANARQCRFYLYFGNLILL